MKEILDQLNLIVTLVDDDFNIIYINKKMKEIFGDVVGKKCYEVFHSLNSPPDFCLILKLLRGEKGEEEFYEPSIGRWFKVVTNKIKFNGKTAFLHLAGDITEIKKTEEIARLIFRNTVEGIAITDGNGTIIRWNPAAEKITGLTEKEVFGKKLWDIIFSLLPKEKKNKMFYKDLKEKISEAIKTKDGADEKDRQYEIELSNGERKIIKQVIIPIKSSKGFMAVSFFRDVTEIEGLREAYRVLVEVYKRQKESNTNCIC